MEKVKRSADVTVAGDIQREMLKLEIEGALLQLACYRNEFEFLDF